MGLTAEDRITVLQGIMDGFPLRKVCRDFGVSRYSVEEAIRTDEGFASQYARACSVRADVVFDEMFEIADTPVIGEKRKINADGTVEVTEGDMIEHRRLQVDARKWALAKMNPKKYGDKMAIGGASDLPPIKHDMTDVARRTAFVLASALEAKDGNTDPATE